MKIYAIANGIFYTLFGLWGLALPGSVAENLGWTLDLLGRHEMRAFFCVIMGLGVLNVSAVMRGFSTRAAVRVIILVTSCFLAGRVLGLILDGPGPMLTYIEIGVEIVWIGLGAILLRLAK